MMISRMSCAYLHMILPCQRLVQLVLTIVVTGSLMTSPAAATELKGSLVIVGRGPERPMIEQLARAFEKAHLGAVVDIRWNRNFRTDAMVSSGEADLAVDGREKSGLTATTVGWDGLAVVVNFSNPVKELTKQQVASLFSGKIRDWSDLDERAPGRVRVVLRADDQNLSPGFERSLGIDGATTQNADVIRSDQKVLSRVSGQLNAVSYLSLKAALDASTYGLSVRMIIIDGVEPGMPTVRSGLYPIKRPVMLVSRKEPKPITQAFLEFVLSPAGQRLVGELYTPLAP
jgi:phosphate transport system substrate-binding protein